MIKKYNKLVRDRIPEIIESSGRTCVTEILSDEDYLKMLDAKLDEELAELLESTPERFLRFPTQYEIHEYRIMEDFIASLPVGAIQRELAEAIRGKGAFRRFKATIRFYGIEQQWYGFLADAYKVIAIQWCKDNQLEYTIDTEN